MFLNGCYATHAMDEEHFKANELSGFCPARHLPTEHLQMHLFISYPTSHTNLNFDKYNRIIKTICVAFLKYFTAETFMLLHLTSLVWIL